MPKAEIDNYLEAVDRLYEEIRRDIKTLGLEAEVREGESVHLHPPEDLEYSAPTLSVVTRTLPPFRFVPRGHRIVGANGRVDLVGDFATEPLLCLGREWVYPMNPKLDEYPPLPPNCCTG